MITCMIVDDEPLALDVLRQYIQTVPDLTLAGSYEKPMEAFAALQRENIDLLFLDIQMPELTGLALLRSLTVVPKVILTTAFRDFAVEGFDLEVLDYLVKPFSKERFLKALNKFYRAGKQEDYQEKYDEPFIFLKVNKEMVRLKFNDVYFIEGLKNHVKIKTTGRDLIVYHSLGYLEDKLPSRVFKRIHKSFIINIDKIDKFTTGAVQIQSNSIPVGKMYQNELDDVLKKRIL